MSKEKKCRNMRNHLKLNQILQDLQDCYIQVTRKLDRSKQTHQNQGADKMTLQSSIETSKTHTTLAIMDGSQAPSKAFSGELQHISWDKFQNLKQHLSEEVSQSKKASTYLVVVLK
jgi:hypothetical protein